eukprot:m.84424 g.84424  ORF g.84424 m.84424 type:complete len:218 (+) comp15019_c0_seq1:67-720(+)
MASSTAAAATAAAASSASAPPTARQVLLYVPNLIGYARCILLLVGFSLTSPLWFCILYCIQAILDGFDGVLARRLNQCSAFGAWFDVVIDNIGRACLWSRISPHFALVGCVEWLTFLCHHASAGAAWKTDFGPAPVFVQRVMANGFKTPLGVAAITGVHVLPIWLYFAPALNLPAVLVYPGALVLIACRLFAFSVEAFFVSSYVQRLLQTPSVTKTE